MLWFFWMGEPPRGCRRVAVLASQFDRVPISLGVWLTETDRFGSLVLRIIRLPEKKNRSVTLKTRNRGISVSGNSVRFRF